MGLFLSPYTAGSESEMSPTWSACHGLPKVTYKEIFTLCYPCGWQSTPTPEDLEFLDRDEDGDVDGSTQREMSPYMVACEKCSHPTYSETKTWYTNPASRAKKCYGMDTLTASIHKAKVAAKDDDKEDAKRIQQDMFSAMAQAIKKDKALFLLIKMVCRHQVAISKVTWDKDFISHLKCSDTPGSYETLIDVML